MTMNRIYCLAAASALAVASPAQTERPVVPIANEVNLTVDCTRSLGALDHDFWASSGQDQDYTLKLFHLNSQNIGSIPHDGCRWFRPHDLLKLVTVSGLEAGRPVYDWSKLDHTLQVALDAGLKPLFEIMGNPSNHFKNFRERDQLEQWQRLVADLARHLEQRFGADEVRSWLFEGWNEPNLMEGKPGLWNNPAEHHNYYDASSEGLKAADPQLRFGGPGISRVNMPYGNYLSTFLDHCDTGTNVMTGEKGVRLDFISFHRKNKPAEMVGVEVECINRILAEHPRFKDLLMMNNESDSEVGWREKYPYRATPWYAAFMARSLNEHLVRIADGGSITGGQRIHYRHSNDDAFWGTWENRTHFALFENEGRVAQIKKPSHTVRTALSLLGDERCEAAGVGLDAPIGIVATRRGKDQVAILLYHYSDVTDAAGKGRVKLTVNHLPFAKGKRAIYRVDAGHGDTHRTWQSMGAPALPTDAQLAALRAEHELAAESIQDIAGSDLTETIELPLPGVAVVVFSAEGAATNDAITHVYTEDYPSLSGHAVNTMIKWRSTSWFVKTFEVLHASSTSGPFQRLNERDQIGTGYLHESAKPLAGFIKIRTIDYWGRPAGESEPVAVGTRR